MTAAMNFFTKLLKEALVQSSWNSARMTQLPKNNDQDKPVISKLTLFPSAHGCFLSRATKYSYDDFVNSQAGIAFYCM